MKNKKRIVLVVFLLIFTGSLQMIVAQENRGPAAVIINHYATRSFLEGTVPAADLDQIIQAGIRAPSASNRQPWYFTIIQNQDLAKKIVSNNVDGNVLIVVSAEGDGKTNTREIIDCSLAVESIYLAAQALGYGSRIYTGPINALNNNLKKELNLPPGHNAVALVRVGRTAAVDAVSAASNRKKAEETVRYIK
ncbi:MAG: nitroreductase family protein [Treponema sp.]|nr:nitroreductase family protein [Treponema sp.]